jgi:hypothetical protein
VQELKRPQLAPKGLERPQVCRLLRVVELRQDVRANAMFHRLLATPVAGWADYPAGD